MILVRKITGAFVESSNSIVSFFSGETSSSTSNPVGLNVFIVFFLAVFIAALAIIGAVFLIEKGFSNSNRNYLDLVNEVAHKTSSLVLLNAVLFVYSFIVSNANVNCCSGTNVNNMGNRNIISSARIKGKQNR